MPPLSLPPPPPTVAMLQVVLLLLLLTGAGRCCPLEPHSIVLDPPEIVGQLGDRVTVNCSSSSAPQGSVIYWSDDSGPLQLERERNFVTWTDTLFWDSHARCRVNTSAGECSRELNITLYKPPEDVLVSWSGAGAMVEGDTYNLTCDIINVAPVQRLNVSWFQGPRLLKDERFEDDYPEPQNISSLLAFTPSRRHHQAALTCRAELELNLGVREVRLTSEPFPLTVHYPPQITCPRTTLTTPEHRPLWEAACTADGNPAPTLRWYHRGQEVNASQPLSRTRAGRYLLTATNAIGNDSFSLDVVVEYAPEFKSRNVDDLSVSAQEGDNITLSCDAEGNPPPAFSWTRNGENIQENSSVLHLPGALSGASYLCQAANKLGIIHKQIQVVVRRTRMTQPDGVWTTASTQRPPPTGCPLRLTPPEVAVRFGDPAEVVCETHHHPDVSVLGWDATEGAVPPLKGVSNVSWSVTAVQDWHVNATCFLKTNNYFHCAMQLPITVYQPPEDVLVSWSGAGAMVEGDTYNLTCDVTNAAPVQRLNVSWFQGPRLLKEERFEDDYPEPQNISSLLAFTPSRRHHQAALTCRAELELNLGVREVRLTSEPFPLTVHYPPQITCPRTTLTTPEHRPLWEAACTADGNPAPTLRWYHRGQEVNASQPLSRTRAGRYLLTATNAIGNDSFSLDVVVEYAPSLRCQQVYSVKEKSEVWPSCDVDGVPLPVVTWAGHGAEAASGRRPVRREDGGQYLVTAHNGRGSVTRTVRLEVLYPPAFARPQAALHAHPGQNRTLPCGPEGNPAPSVSWIYKPSGNVREEASGLAITQATPANTGVYTCVATNALGRANATITLTVSSGPSKLLHAALIVGPLLLLLLVLLLAFIITRRKRHGRYSFVSIPLKTTPRP